MAARLRMCGTRFTDTELRHMSQISRKLFYLHPIFIGIGENILFTVFGHMSYFQENIEKDMFIETFKTLMLINVM